MTCRLSFGMKHEIAERYIAGETAAALADEFNINKSTVRRITEAIHPGFRKTEDDHGRS
jgi:Helix-turn-helix domain of resolvase.